MTKNGLTRPFTLLGRKQEHAASRGATTNAAGETVQFSYHYNLLTDKHYPRLPQNDVHYDYDAYGHLIGIQDGSGRQQLFYDRMGRVSKNIRTFAVPFSHNTYTFTMEYEYDSWNRMLSMTYPDGEVVTYRYAYGGDLESMEGDKGTEHYDYLSGIEYNDYGQRIHVSYGNGATCDYSYDALHRLVGLTSMSSIGEMQNISYTIDGVGNIHNVENYAIALPIGIGGYYLNSHSYDDLDRLTASSGSGALGNYAFSADYSPSGRLNHKTLIVTMEAVSSYNNYYYGYCSQARPHAPRRIYDLYSDILTDLQWDGAGNLGQVNSAQHGEYNASRFLFWTEDNRLYTVADDKHHSYYAYDHAGDRTLKFTGTSSLLDINADQMVTSAVLKELTMYPTPYVVATNQGYTKHYYAGSDRVAARIGGGGLEPMEYIQEQTERADGLFANCTNRITDRELESNVSDCIEGEQTYECKLQLPISDIPSSFYSETEVNAQPFVNTMDYFITASEEERDVYFYHSDHLGSASWITDNQGVPVQHLQYLPYGEPFVNQRSTGYNERFTFTGKEKDSETGYSYFGARYLEHELTAGWLSVDPMADKYPSLSPYAYCAWNPVKLVDPEGSEIGDYYTRDGKWLGHDKNINDNKVYICDGLDENNCAINKNELLITHKQFREKAATVYGESSAYRYSGNTVPDDLKCEMFAIASVLERNKNAYGAKSKKANDFLKDTPEQNNKNNFRVTANAAVINALTGGFDYSYGATQWDGMEQALYPETENSSHLNGYELHMNTMGWTIPDKLYEKWKNNVGKGFKAPQEKEAVAGRNKGRKRLTAKAVYCRTIFWKSS